MSYWRTSLSSRPNFHNNKNSRVLILRMAVPQKRQPQWGKRQQGPTQDLTGGEEGKITIRLEKRNTWISEVPRKLWLADKSTTLMSLSIPTHTYSNCIRIMKTNVISSLLGFYRKPKLLFLIRFYSFWFYGLLLYPSS